MVVLYHYRAKARYWSKIANFFVPLHSTPPLGGPGRNTALMFGTEKLKWCGYPMVKKSDDMFSRFDTIPACDRRTNILRQHSPRYAQYHVVTRSSAVAQRPRDASCLSVVSFNIPTAQFFYY